MKRTLDRKFLLWTVALVLLLGIMVHFVHSFQVRRNAGSLLDQADRANNEGNFDQAHTYYTHYLAYEPEDADTLVKFALALEQHAKNPDDWLRVAGIFEQALRLQPSRDDLRYRLLLNQIQLHRFREAIANIQVLLPHWENKAELEHVLGWCLEANGDYPKSAAAFARAIALDPHRQESYVILAEILQNRLDQPEDAAKVMDDLVHANSQSYRAYLARSQFRQQLNLQADADKDLNKALELAPREPTVLLTAADRAQSQGDLKKARQWIQKAREVSSSRDLDKFSLPDRARILHAMAGIWDRLGDNKQSEELWRRLAQEQPGDVTSRFHLFENALRDQQPKQARVLLDEMRKLEGDQGKYWQYGKAALLVYEADPNNKAHWQEARNILEKLVRSQKSWPAIPLLMARINEGEGLFDKAIDHFLLAVELGERQPRKLSRLIQLLVRFKRYWEAENVLHKIEETQPLPADMMRWEAEIALANQNYKEALKLASQAVPFPSKDYRDYLWLGRIYHRAGADDKAEEVLRQGIVLAPYTPDTWVALAEQLTRMGKRGDAQSLLIDGKEKVSPQLKDFTQARCAEAMGLITQAEDLYLHALAQKTDDFVLLAHAADFFRRTEQSEKAEPLLERLINMAGAAPIEYISRARRNLALLLAGKEGSDKAKALALIDCNIQAHPNSVTDARARAVILGNRSQAIHVFEETARRQPLSLDEQLQLARLFEAEQDLTRTREHLVALLTEEPENTQLLAFSIRHLLQANEIDQAQDLLRKLDLLEPDSPRVKDLKDKLAKKK